MTAENFRGDETAIEKHTRLARQMLDDAQQEIAAGDLTQGGEKLWGATSQALRAYCERHGLPHGKYHHRRQALLDLAERLEEPSIRAAFAVAQSCHANFHHDHLYQEDLDTYLPDIRELVRVVLAARVG